MISIPYSLDRERETNFEMRSMACKWSLSLLKDEGSVFGPSAPEI